MFFLWPGRAYLRVSRLLDNELFYAIVTQTKLLLITKLTALFFEIAQRRKAGNLWSSSLRIHLAWRTHKFLHSAHRHQFILRISALQKHISLLNFNLLVLKPRDLKQFLLCQFLRIEHSDHFLLFEFANIVHYLNKINNRMEPNTKRLVYYQDINYSESIMRSEPSGIKLTTICLLMFYNLYRRTSSR